MAVTLWGNTVWGNRVWGNTQAGREEQTQEWGTAVANSQQQDGE